MDVELPVFSGYLNVPTQSGFSINRISKKKHYQKYCLLFKSSRHGIERLEICESKDDKNPKIITLENCVKITQEPSPANLIQIVKKTGTLTLNTLTEDDLKDWVSALQTVAFRNKSSSGSQTVIEEDNDLYCSSFGDGLFIVTLIPSDTSIRCNIEPKDYMLNLTATELQLNTAEDPNIVVAKWPYRFIRKYGYRDGKFTFEAGRKCFTGEGVFTLEHTNPQEVFRCMSAKMKSMKKLISGENLSNIQPAENQLSIAASMEAGSRSPLPPSPSNQQNTDFEINSTQSCMTVRGFISSSDSLNNFAITSNVNNNISAQLSSVKKIPHKPPRKLPLSLDKLSTPSLTPINSNSPSDHKSSQLICDKFKQFQSYEPVSITSADSTKTGGSAVILFPKSPEPNRKNIKAPDLPVRNESAKKPERDYASIEAITDAWKTLGVGDVKHTERALESPNNDEFIHFVWQRSVSQREKECLKESMPSVMTPKIIDIDIGEGGNYIGSFGTDITYDRLDFLTPNNKSSSGYKTIVNVTSPTNRTACPFSANDYELIASPDIQSCRKADDSHLGYGILRKSSSGFIKPAQSINDSTTTMSKPVDDGPMVASSKTTTKLNEAMLDHRSYNGINYTIVSKPKRV